MQRRALTDIANDLQEALDSSYDAFQEMLSAYTIARKVFTATENDPDPDTIAIGLQAQALGIRTLAMWLGELANETSIAYAERAQEVLNKTHRNMDILGIVIPDVMTL